MSSDRTTISAVGSDSPFNRRRHVLEVGAPIIPPLLAVGLFVAWAIRQGGFAETTWYPGAILLVAVLATVLASAPSLISTTSRLTHIAVASLAAWSGWMYLSIAWADVKTDAWTGANRSLLLAVTFALFAIGRLSPASALILMLGYAASIAGLLLATLVRASSATDPTPYIYAGRFEEPMGYPNANVALALAALWPALVAASRREVHWALRGIALGAAGALVAVAVLGQSRGSMFATPLVLALYVLLVPARVRSMLSLALVAAAVGPVVPHLLAVYEAADSPIALSMALGDATRAVLISVAGLTVAGAILGLVDRRLSISPGVSRVTGRLVFAVCAVAIAGAVVVGLARVGNPVDRLASAWAEFTAIDEGTGTATSTSRFTGGLGSNRYDFWRVALGELSGRPLLGIGADNFAAPYLKHRRSPESPKYAHSIAIDVVSQGGAVGGLLFGIALGTAVAGAFRARRPAEPLRWAVAATALVAFAYWFVHGAVDWFLQYPALAAPAFAWLGLATSMGSRAPDRAPVQRLHGRAVIGGVGVFGLSALLLLVPPWLSARDTESAGRMWRHDRAGAYDRLERARALNFLSDLPDMVEAGIAVRTGDLRRAGLAFERALERNPHNWYAWLQSGAIDAQLGRHENAIQRLERARFLNPREPLVVATLASVRAGQLPSPRDIAASVLEELRSLET